MERADIILVQLTADQFMHEHLRSSVVAARYPDKTAIWPNLFYSGQQPFLRYLTHPEISRINGPLDVYHDISILHEWRVARQTTSKTDIDLDDLKSRISEASLRELERRESKCSAGVSDIISDQRKVKRLFFTFNHPTVWLVTQLGKRLGAFLNLGPEIDTAITKEFLNLITVPSELPPSEASNMFWGKEFTLEEQGQICLGRRKKYTNPGIKEAFFACYDHMSSHYDLSSLRRTPKFELDRNLILEQGFNS